MSLHLFKRHKEVANNAPRGRPVFVPTYATAVAPTASASEPAFALRQLRASARGSAGIGTRARPNINMHRRACCMLRARASASVAAPGQRRTILQFDQLP
eukprot:COSAG02_NODE_4608_length_5171_cov_3.998028_3_plen_100_part_00